MKTQSIEKALWAAYVTTVLPLDAEGRKASEAESESTKLYAFALAFASFLAAVFGAAVLQ